MNTIKDLINKIILLEKKYKLFKQRFKNYSIWPYYRMYFYYSISYELKILDKSVNNFKINLKYLKKSLNIFNLKKLLEKKDYFILEHPRSNKNNIDIYTYDIVKYLGEENCSFFSFSQNGKIEKKNRVIILDLIKIFAKVISKFFYFFVKTDNSFQDFLKEFREINEIKYLNLYKRYTLELIIQYYFFYFLLKIKKPKKVILVVSYYNMPLIFAAKNLNIEVIEMQHGIISKYHLGYHYPYYESDFFPEYLFTFSKFWNKSASYPSPNIKNVGNNFLYVKNKKSKKQKNTILIISQATIGVKLENFILKNMKFFKNYKIYFKLHPNEFDNYKLKYEKLINLKNVIIVLNEFNINELQNFCEYQIGIYSTAIYEGIERNCKTLLLNEIGVEYMEQLLKEKLAVLIDYNDNLIHKMSKIPIPKDVKFFDEFKIKGKI